jgi:hypothetical protein
VNAFEKALAEGLPAVGSGLLEAALVNGGVRVVEKFKRVGLITIQVTDVDDSGHALLNPQGKEIMITRLAYPDRDPGEEVCSERIQTTEPRSVSAMKFIAAQVAGRPITPTEEMEYTHEEMAGVLIDMAAAVERVVSNGVQKARLIEVIRGLARRLDSTDDPTKDRVSDDPDPRAIGDSGTNGRGQAAAGSGPGLAGVGSVLRATGGGAADGGVPRADLGVVRGAAAGSQAGGARGVRLPPWGDDDNGRSGSGPASRYRTPPFRPMRRGRTSGSPIDDNRGTGG